MFAALIFAKGTQEILININVKVSGHIFSITRFSGSDSGTKME